MGTPVILTPDAAPPGLEAGVLTAAQLADLLVTLQVSINAGASDAHTAQLAHHAFCRWVHDQMNPDYGALVLGMESLAASLLIPATMPGMEPEAVATYLNLAAFLQCSADSMRALNIQALNALEQRDTALARLRRIRAARKRARGPGVQPSCCCEADGVPS